MDRTPKQVQDLTLALLYLTSLEDHDDPASRRCWKGYDFQTLADLQAQGLVEDTQGRIPLRLPPQGIAQAKAVLQALGLEPAAMMRQAVFFHLPDGGHLETGWLNALTPPTEPA